MPQLIRKKPGTAEIVEGRSSFERPASAGSVLDEALRLCQAGWWIVPQSGKRAIVLGWNELCLSELDLSEYLADGRLNIAVALNHSPCIDVECDSPAAEEQLQALCGELPPTPTWKSRRGLHRLFLRPAEAPDKAKEMVGEIEVRGCSASAGALSTLPPSRHPDDGTEYAWLPGLSIWEVDPAPMPEPLVKALKKAAGKRKSGPVEERSEGSSIASGRRNDELFRVGCRALRSMSVDDVASLLTGMNQRHCDPPLSEEEVKKIVQSVASQKERAKKEIVSSFCSSFEELIESWQEALEWRRSIQEVFSCMLAVAASTSQTGNQLFLQVVGEPGSAKTRLCDAMLVSPTCKRVERINNIFSGMMDWGDKDRDFSFIARANHKTWISPETDLLASSPGYAQVMSQMRRAFDGSTSITHGNRDNDLDYNGLRTPWIQAGTPAMIDRRHSALGDRFLRIYMDQPDDEVKRRILRKVALTELDAMCIESNCSPESTLPPKLLRAYRLTGGYVDWLRQNATSRIRAVRANLDDEMVIDRLTTLAEWTAAMRSTPPDLQYGQEPDYAAIKELPSRLQAQFLRLALCLAVVWQRPTVDAEVLALVRRVALDTGRGRAQTIVGHLAKARTDPKLEHGVIPSTLAVWMREDEKRIARWLVHMSKVGVVQGRAPSVGQPLHWTMTERTLKLHREVHSA